jgi:hypothetical protein
MPEDAFSQEESDDRFWTFLNRPGLRQFSDKTVKIPVVFDQPVEDEAVDVTGGRILCKNGIKKGGIANRALNQLIHFLRRLGANEDNTDRKQQKKKDWRNEKKGLDLQGRFPFDSCQELEITRVII